MYRKENRFEDIYCIDTLTLLAYFYLLLKINLAALQLWQHGDTKKLVCSITITIFIGSPPYFNGMGISEILVSYRQVNFIYGDLILRRNLENVFKYCQAWRDFYVGEYDNVVLSVRELEQWLQ